MLQTIISPSTIHTALWVVALMLIDYTGVFAAIIIDLRSGTLKSKRLGLPRTSEGYRRSVDKASRYFITLLALSVIDAMLILSAMLLRATMGWSIPVFPLFTTIGAISLTLIEVKSIMENAQAKSDFTDTADAITQLLDDESISRLTETLNKLRRLKYHKHS